MYEDLAERVEALEQAGRRGRRVAFLTGAACALVLVGVQSCAPTAQELQVQSLEVVDDQGQAGIRMAGSTIEVLEEGVPRARLAVTGGTAELAFSTAKGVERASIGMLSNDPVLLMGDLASEPELQLTVGRNGSGLRLRDREGQTQADLSVTAHGTQLVLRDEGRERTFLPEEKRPTP